MTPGRPFTRDAAVAKLIASDAAMKVTTDAVQVLGGYGYTRDFPAERYMREAKVTQIFEGTNQIQRLVIGRQLLRAALVRLTGGDVVLVTGGASGLGAATVRALLAEGASVVIMDLPGSPGAALAAELGDRVRFAAADVRDEDQVAAAIATAAELGTLRVAVNCAGVATPGPGASASAACCRWRPSGPWSRSTWSAPSTCCGWRPRP